MKKIISLFLAMIIAVSLFSITSVSAATVTVGKVTNLKLVEVYQSKVELDWKDVSGATGYEVYKYNFSKKIYENIGYVNTSKVLIDKLTSATNYIFKIRAYKNVSGKTYRGDFSDKLKITTRPKRPENISVSAYSESSVTLKWNAVKRATGYRIYYYDSASAKYIQLTDVTGTKCTIVDFPANTAMRIKLRAYRTVDGKRTYSYITDYILAGTRPKAPSNIFASKNNFGKIQICFAPVDGAAGYLVYKYNKETSEYEKIKSSKNNVIDLTLNFDNYDFKLKSYYKVDDKYFYSVFSDLFSTMDEESSISGETEEEKAWEDEVLVYVNRERNNQGLSQLKMDSALRAAARARAKEMYEAGILSHTRPNGESCNTIFAEYNIPVIDSKTGRVLKNWGENIARGQKTPRLVYEAWYGSTGHRENMLRPAFNYIGVGYYKGYWVQLFTS
jgi:uncharacterized protein YkwD